MPAALRVSAQDPVPILVRGLVAEIETGTRYRASAFAAETDYGVVLADRIVWLPVDMLGEYFGQLTPARRERVIGQIVAVLRGGGSAG